MFQRHQNDRRCRPSELFVIEEDRYIMLDRLPTIISLLRKVHLINNYQLKVDGSI